MNTENPSEEEIQEIALRKIRSIENTNEYEDWNPQIDEYIELFEDLAAMEKPQLDIATKHIIMSEILANNELEDPSYLPSYMLSVVYSVIVLALIGTMASLIGLTNLLTSFTSLIIISTAATFLLIALRDESVSFQYKLRQL